MLRISLLINIFFSIYLFNFIYGIDQHQVIVYTGVGYSKQILDKYQNVYDTPLVSTGIKYRYNKFLSRTSIHYFSIELGMGGGAVFPRLRNSIATLNYNSFLEFELSAGYGISLGKYKEHQVPIIGIGFLPRFYGLSERDDFTHIGSTEIEWSRKFYIPISLAIKFPSYRYIYNQFFIGFQHSLTMLVTGHQNVNVPRENLILQSLGYQFQLELGLNYDNFSSKNSGISLRETTVFIETNRNGITISLFAKTENEQARTATIEYFALNEMTSAPTLTNLIGYASMIPIFNEQAQFTKHWKGKNYFEEEMLDKQKILYIVIKEIDKDNRILQEHFLYKSFKEQEKSNEKN